MARGYDLESSLTLLETLSRHLAMLMRRASVIEHDEAWGLSADIADQMLIVEVLIERELRNHRQATKQAHDSQARTDGGSEA